MNKINRLIKFLIIFFLFSFAVLNKTYAQSTLPLVVMPARQEIEVKPGEKSYVTVSFYNQSDQPISGFFKVADFIVEDSNGSPRLIENLDETNPRFSASSWLKLTYDRATLPANNKVSLQGEIDVPLSARPGGRYVAIFFEHSTSPEKNQNQLYQAGMGTSSRIASLLYIKVAGPTTEKAIVSRFFTPYFLEYGPIKIQTQILNRGDYHIAPKGIITMKDVFGKIVDQGALKEKNIFPDMVRNYENELGKKWMIGKYHITLSAYYGEKGQVLDGVVDVWVFPWRAALVVALTIIILIILISNLYKNFVKKEIDLETQLKKEQEEIEKLKEQLRKKN
ncbi:MAG: hypothetical protein Fur009_4620 [Candidatus Microgenomates bacterium]